MQDAGCVDEDVAHDVQEVAHDVQEVASDVQEAVGVVGFSRGAPMGAVRGQARAYTC